MDRWLPLWLGSLVFLGGFGNLGGREVSADPCLQGLQKARASWGVGARQTALQQIRGLLSRCQSARIALTAARWSVEAQQIDQALNHYGQAMAWTRSEEERQEYKVELQRSQERYVERVKEALQRPVPLKPQGGSGFRGIQGARGTRAIRVRQRLYQEACPEAVSAPKTTGTRAIRVVRRPSEPLQTKILFQTGRATIRPEGQFLLEALVQAVGPLLQGEGVCLLIIGHTDSVGSSRSNQTLSHKRAQSVRAFLQKKGLEPRKLFPRGMGAEQPLTSNQTPEGRSENRRVEFVFLKP